MSEKTYLSNNEAVKSYVDLNYLDLNKHEKIWKNTINAHCFNQALSIFLPSCSINLTTEHLDQNLGHYYHIEAPLSILLEPDFFKKYIKSDQCQLMMHSLDTNINSDNVVVLKPNGELCFSLVKDTFEKFGMVSLKRTKADIKHDKHIVMVNLKKSSFHEDSKEYNRLKWCLENTLTDKFKLVFCLIDTLTGTTLDIQFPLVENISKFDMTAEFETLTDINIPSFTNLNCQDNWDNEAMEALEWIGLSHLKANRIKKSSQKLDPFVSVYQPPLPLSNTSTGTLVKFKGFIPPSSIQNIMILLQKLNITEQWISLTCWGYRDSPITWNNTSHYEYLNSENDYTVLILPNKKNAYLYQLYGSHHLKF